MENPENHPSDSLTDQIRRLIQDGIDYAASALRLLQAQVTAMALSSVAFVVLIFGAILAGLVAFALLSVALGIWLTHATGSAGYALLIMGGVYALIMLIAGGIAVRWLSRLRS